MPLTMLVLVRRPMGLGGVGLVMVTFASVLHLIWAGCLLLSPLALQATPLSMMGQVLGGQDVMLVVMVGASLLAFWGSLLLAPLWSLVMMLPQQGLLILSAAAALRATYLGAYADGTAISPYHIFTDQVVYVLMAVMYMVAVVLAHVETTAAHDERGVLHDEQVAERRGS